VPLGLLSNKHDQAAGIEFVCYRRVKPEICKSLQGYSERMKVKGAGALVVEWEASLAPSVSSVSTSVVDLMNHPPRLMELYI
jgi:hypothetical protein